MPIPDGDPPLEFRIWTWGENKTVKGSVFVDEESARAVVAAYNDHGIDLAIDYEHQTFNAEENGKPAPAAGWFRPEVRNDGLWATQVRWTDEAKKYLQDRAYRYFSPVALIDKKTRKPERLMPMALTNWPATKDIEPLVARADELPGKEIHMKTVLVALGLKADADELTAEKQAIKLRKFKSDVLSLAGRESGSDALGVLAALKLKAEKADSLEAELVKLRDEQVATEKTALIDDAIQNRGVAPAKRAELEALELSSLKVVVSMFPKKSEAATPPTEKPSSPLSLSDGELNILKITGLSPEKYAAHKKVYRQAMKDMQLRTIDD